MAHYMINMFVVDRRMTFAYCPSCQQATSSCSSLSTRACGAVVSTGFNRSDNCCCL